MIFSQLYFEAKLLRIINKMSRAQNGQRKPKKALKSYENPQKALKAVQIFSLWDLAKVQICKGNISFEHCIQNLELRNEC